MTNPLICKKAFSDQLIFKKINRPSKFLERNNGLMFKEQLNEDEAIMLESPGLQWIHTFFMKFSIDVIYLSKKMKVIKIKKNVQPNTLTLPVLGAWSVIECTANNKNLNQINIGDIIYVGS